MTYKTIYRRGKPRKPINVEQMLNGISSQKIKIKKMILFHYAILLATF